MPSIQRLIIRTCGYLIEHSLWVGRKPRTGSDAQPPQQSPDSFFLLCQPQYGGLSSSWLSDGWCSDEHLWLFLEAVAGRHGGWGEQESNLTSHGSLLQRNNVYQMGQADFIHDSLSRLGILQRQGYVGPSRQNWMWKESLIEVPRTLILQQR